MSIFLFGKDKREETEDYISIGFWWDKEPKHKLSSYSMNNDGVFAYYLFNFIKIWQAKS